ncbi:hypothetical protein [Aequorivita echinoideorum]|uniref:Uncharacterized protein n=1 Tax=Aequorivita echinoideorum TaxID=1549647 RepID=A0ABS5S2B5_9FLAO|nr:hypothetical protein [Aequorivita echinoideorum]MBT0607354.1 hypothetical protein [Aequorivita echinoideorum]
MKIKSNASSGELSSPFYQINKDFCSDFEDYIASKNGRVRGNFNAWSYFIEAKIEVPKLWKLTYKRATYSSTGNLLLSSKSQSLLTSALWETKLSPSDCSEFVIQRAKNTNMIKRLFGKQEKFKDTVDYVIKGAEGILTDRLYSILFPLFKTGELYNIYFRDNKLAISLRSNEHHFNIFNKLLKLN